MVNDSGWVYFVRLDDCIEVMELLHPYVRVIEDVPNELMAIDELSLAKAIDEICFNLTSGKPKIKLEIELLGIIEAELLQHGLVLKDYDIRIALEPSIVAFLKPRS
jgi:hypothetical protein